MGESAQPGQLRWPIYLLAGFPIVDYFLHIYPWGIIGAGWDKLVLFVVAIFALRSYMMNGRKMVYPTHRMVIYMAVLGLMYILMDVGYGAVAFAGYRIDFMYMLYSLLLPYVVAKEDIVPLLKVMVFTGILMAMHGVYEYITKAPMGPTWTVVAEHVRTRVYSLFGSPNIFGDYAAFLLPSAIGVALYETDKGQRRFFILGALLLAISMLFTFTRAAWLAGFVGVLVMTWLVDKRFTIGAIGVAILAALFVHSVQVRIEEFFSPVYWYQTFANGRIARWLNAYDQMRANPLFGAGLGRYGGAVASKYFGVTYVDGYFAKTLAETGLVGLFSFVAVLFVYLRDVWRVMRSVRDPRMKLLFTGVFSSLVAVVTHNLVENVFEEPAMNMLFWLAGTLVLIYGAQEVDNRG